VDISSAPFDGDVYEISTSVLEETPELWQTGPVSREVTPATYLLKDPVSCPNCNESIRSVHVLGLMGRVASESGEQRGLVVSCPKCTGSVPAQLVGL
jgi:uncharacterized protein with PIN domain